jgi:putative DNA primase/helicase
MIGDLKERANGRWASILAALGVERSYLTGKHGPCPICREGKDRFRFADENGDGSWYCNRAHGGSVGGDGFDLLRLVRNETISEVARAVESVVGSAPKQTVEPKADPDRVRGQMNALWRNSGPLTALDATVAWWMARVGAVPGSTELRAARLAYQDGLDGPRSYHPGMIARVVGADGQVVNIHRTYLTPEGTKAPVRAARKVMPIDLPAGAAVRLSPSAKIMGIAEGIETAVSASLMFRVPVWACLNTSLLASWAPPPGVEHVMIFADHDLPDKDGVRPGRKAAEKLAGRLIADCCNCEIRMPPIEGQDWNDVHRDRLQMKETA